MILLETEFLRTTTIIARYCISMLPNIQILRMLPCLHLEDGPKRPAPAPMRLRARTELSLPECYPHESRCTLWKEWKLVYTQRDFWSQKEVQTESSHVGDAGPNDA